MNDFGRNLKELRKNWNLTLDELSQKLGIDKSTLSRYESGQRKPNHEVEENIADFFNVSLDELRGYIPINYSIHNTSPEAQMIVAFMKDMDIETRRSLLKYAEFLYNNQKRGD